MNDTVMIEDVKIIESKPLLKLDLGSADRPKEGFESVDFHHPAAQHKVNLFKFPFPWADNSVEQINCSHFLEHLPAREVEWSDMADCEELDVWQPRQELFRKSFLGKDFLGCFMSECWRILVNGIDRTTDLPLTGGDMFVTVPNARCNRAFQDPTHRRFFVAETFLYFNKAWRDSQGLSHYLSDCDFVGNACPIIPNELALLSDAAQARVFNENWNTVLDWYAQMKAKK